MDSTPFFKVNHTYRHRPGAACDERFYVEHVATPPERFARIKDIGPTAFGWIVALKPDGSEVRFGSYNFDDFATWELDRDAEITPRVAYRAEYAGMVLGQYLDPADARKHCEVSLDANEDPMGRPFVWRPFSPLAPDEVELCLGHDEETTGYSVVTVPILPRFAMKDEG